MIFLTEKDKLELLQKVNGNDSAVWTYFKSLDEKVDKCERLVQELNKQLSEMSKVSRSGYNPEVVPRLDELQLRFEKLWTMITEKSGVTQKEKLSPFGQALRRKI